MSKIYYGDRASGGSLKHYRTKGSRNGYSKNPNYKVVGQKAKGRWVNGRYVYDNPAGTSKGFLSGYNQYHSVNTNKPSGMEGDPRFTVKPQARPNSGRPDPRGNNLPSGMGHDPRYTNPKEPVKPTGANAKLTMKGRVKKLSDKGAQNNWQQQAIKAAAQGNLGGKIARGEVRAAKANNGDVYSAKELGYQGSSKSKKAVSKSHKPHEALHVDTPSPDPSSWRYTTVDKTAMGRRVDTNRVEDSPNGGTRYATEIVDPRYNVQGTQKIEAAKQEAARKAKEKETKGQYFTFDEKTGRTVKTSPGIEAEKARIAAGEKAREKRQKKRERAAKRQALINKIKSKIKGFFS